VPEPLLDAPALLGAVADALNACEAAGLKPRLRRDVVHTHAGWVLPPIEDHQAWVARFPSVPGLPPGDPDDIDD
jgi:hypothetical protein